MPTSKLTSDGTKVERAGDERTTRGNDKEEHLSATETETDSVYMVVRDVDARPSIDEVSVDRSMVDGEKEQTTSGKTFFESFAVLC